ncbi:hypothetical protein CWI42_051880 [Ordospora colligata]|uniref:SMP-LTD domain-containing protein n=1 Tax=Ordospora colligata OC4 TaxID=1354746 RepID=A0A0B2UKQ5_9MICR|nr:uncharacterized protein M896_051930 [Ordospora colligata OC4]KHN69784.1 hypothetical protein M896_051930 [Ordospora colligata OC4]TBU15587.1 hypothetical protein CWI41_051920 [Ordospora colligata]TBU15654.1 hypothetical protein CWI40_051900 [Ordospora colligata]TBU18705.1 hypothetical protein CWI42_051880 [Ordospora colligata]
MLVFAAGFIAGLLSFPLAFCLIPFVAGKAYKKRMLRIAERSKKVDISAGQSNAVLKGMHRCVDVHWMNVMLQRLYVEMSKSHAVKLKVKSMILKKVESSGMNKYIKSIEVSDITLGSEAPYVSSVQVVSDEDVRRMAACNNEDVSVEDAERLSSLGEEIKKDLGLDEDTIKSLPRSATEIDIRNSVNEMCKADKEMLSNGLEDVIDGVEISKRRCDGTNDSQQKSMSTIHTEPYINTRGSVNLSNENGNEDEASRKAFENLQVVFGIDYKGGLQISLSLELPRKVLLKVVVSIGGVRGNVLVKMPSKNYDTRYEYCFVSKPDLAITVESGIVSSQGKLGFRKSISKFIERYIRQVVFGTMVYPYWNEQYLPFVIPSIKDVLYSIEKVTPSNFEAEIEKISEQIKLYILMDYKIIEIENEIVYRRIGYFINGSERIYCTHFVIPQVSLKTSHFYRDNRFFKGLSVQESRVMSLLYNWEMFSDVISGFKGMKTLHILSSEFSLVEAVFDEDRYEFVRIVMKNGIIFQRNDPNSPEFIVFRISEEVLYVYQYVKTRKLMMNKKRMSKVKSKLELKPFTSLGLVSLYRLIKFSKQTALSYFKPSSDLCNEDDEGCGVYKEQKEIIITDIKEKPTTELVEIFEDIIADVNTSKYVLKSICSRALPESIYRVLKQDEVRMKLFSEYSEIYTVVQETNAIRSIVVENKVFTDRIDAGLGDVHQDELIEASRSGIANDFVVHSYFGEQIIADLRFGECKDVFVYKIDKMEDNTHGYKSKVELYYSESACIRFPNYFFEAFMLRIRQDEYMSIVSAVAHETSPIEKMFKKEIDVYQGALYIEFFTDAPDDYTLTIHKANSGEVVYEIYKVITSRKARMVIPSVGGKEGVVITLVPKFNRNSKIHHKIISLPEMFRGETLVDCSIGLSKNMKFRCMVSGTTDSVIFWEKCCDDEVRGYIEDNTTRVAIKGCGTMRTDNKEYSIYYKNKGNKKREIRVFVGLSLKKE